MRSSPVTVRRLRGGDDALARELFTVMAETFEEEYKPLGESYLRRLLAREEFWALAALVDDRVVGGLTAHSLPMTRDEATELFIYDLAVHPDHQRRGIGRRLLAELRRAASEVEIRALFVAADDADLHALDFYRGAGGAPSPVTFFTFPDAGGDVPG